MTNMEYRIDMDVSKAIVYEPCPILPFQFWPLNTENDEKPWDLRVPYFQRNPHGKGG